MAKEKAGLLFRPAERFYLDPDSPIPLYHQLERIILDRIKEEKNAVGRMLPAEKDLMQMFGVSRATVKKTFDNLAAKGLVERRRALGTRVIGQEITEDLARLTSFTEEMERKGLKTSTQVLEVAVRVPEPWIAQRLHLQPDEETLSIRRLRGTSEFFPVVLLRSEVPVGFGLDPGDDYGGSLYRLLEGKYKIPIDWAEEEIRAANATEDEAEHLGIRPGDTVLVMERVTFTPDHRALEFVRGVYRPEYYNYSIRLKR
jgi:GntR family transcriptional regulator